MTRVVVLDFDAGSRWQAALEAAGWPGPVIAPDLPPSSDGYGELLDPAWFAADLADASSVVVGIGDAGWSALVLALGGRASAVALVDGLGPWGTPEEAFLAQRDWLRAGGTSGVVPMMDRDQAERALGALTVPLLMIETPASPAASLVASVVTLRSRTPSVVAIALVEWAVASLSADGRSTHS